MISYIKGVVSSYLPANHVDTCSNVSLLEISYTIIKGLLLSQLQGHDLSLSLSHLIMHQLLLYNNSV